MTRELELLAEWVRLRAADYDHAAFEDWDLRVHQLVNGCTEAAGRGS